MDEMKDQEKLFVSVQARLDQVTAIEDVKHREILFNRLKRFYEPMFPQLFTISKKNEEPLLPRTNNPEYDRVLEECESNLKNVDSGLKNIFLRVAQKAISNSIAPLSSVEKKLLPPEKIVELEADPVKARQVIFQKENSEVPIEKKIPKPMMRNEMHLRPEEPDRWIIEKVLPEGLTFLGSQAFGGKSLISMLMVEQFIRGEKFLGRFDQFTGEACDVLYFDWEKVESEIIKRIKKVAPLHDESIKGRAGYFAIDTHGQPRTQKDFVALCNAYLEENPKVKIIVVDTLPRIVAEKTGGGSDYHWETKTLGDLQNWAKLKRVAVLALLHTTKGFNEKASNLFDSFLGGAGLQGVADCCWLLLRPKSVKSDYGEFLTECKVGDMECFSFELEIKKSVWSIVGDLKREPRELKTTRTTKKEVISEKPEEPEKTSKTIIGDKGLVLETLKVGAKTPKEVCDALGKIDDKFQVKVRKILSDLKKGGVITQEEKFGRYCLRYPSFTGV